MTHANRVLGDATEAPTDGVAVHAFVDQGLGNTSWVLEVDGAGVASTRPGTRRPTRPSPSAEASPGSSPPRPTSTPISSQAAQSFLLAGRRPSFPPGRRRSMPTGGLPPATRSRSVASPSGRWPPEVTHPSTSPTCSSTDAAPSACSRGDLSLAGAVARTDLIAPERGAVPAPFRRGPAHVRDAPATRHPAPEQEPLDR